MTIGSETVRELGALTWREVEAAMAERPVGLLPVGAIEAHGPHLPLETDVIIARGMARSAAALLADDGIPTLVLPPVCYGVSFVGTCFPGTSPADAGAVQAYVRSVLVHLAGQGYRALALCNAHLEPAHVEALGAAARAAASESGVPVVFPDKREPRWAERLSEEFRRGSRHAGSYETSLVLAAQPEAVRREIQESLPPVWIDLPARLRAGARSFTEAGGLEGYFGDPARASRAEGERLFRALGGIVRDAVLEALQASSDRA